MSSVQRSLVGAIDQGTSSSRFMVFAAGDGSVVAVDQLEVEQLFPEKGWVEQRPGDILQSVLSCVEGACDKLRKQGVPLEAIKSIGKISLVVAT